MPLFFSRILSITTISVALSLPNIAQAQSSSNACERWLCMPGSTIFEVAKGSNPFNAGCISPYFDYVFRVAIPFQSAMTNFENCMARDYSNRHPEVRVKGDVDTPGFFGGNWEEYELEIFENGIRTGQFKFDHRKNRILPFIAVEDPRRPAVRDVSSNGDFGNTLLFPLGR